MKNSIETEIILLKNYLSKFSIKSYVISKQTDIHIIKLEIYDQIFSLFLDTRLYEIFDIKKDEKVLTFLIWIK